MYLQFQLVHSLLPDSSRHPQAAQHSQGIQTLLEAEKEAAKIVQQARQYRVQRLKDARSEASKEIEEYRREKEAEFKAFEASHAGSTFNAQAAVDKETEWSRNFLDRVVLIKPELHRNLTKLGGAAAQ
ncbi:H+-ATPase G subunit-domain-containing protein [Melanogaster broomeanus]|nr:H+-ATPase G subunit-domain-containing protein [Melanogaster broomeanus]